MLPDFPDFTPLKIEDKDQHDSYISNYEPYSDILFSTLHIWWNFDGMLEVSTLNRNLVIHYNLPFDPDNSGYGLVGENAVDQSIQEVLDYLKENSLKPKLVHVPEFVIDKIKQKNKFKVEEEKDYAEYIINSRKFYELNGKDYESLRYKINRFHRDNEEKKLEIRSLDLGLESDRNEIRKFIADLEIKYPPKNDKLLTEHEAIKKSLDYADVLNLQNIVLYIDGELFGIAIFDEIKDKKYYIGHHLKVNYDIPYISEYMHHEIAKRAVNNGIDSINIEMDLGIENLRKHKMRLKPERFLRKYKIEPAHLD